MFSNHIVDRDVRAQSSDSAFSAQVDALLTKQASEGLDVTSVVGDSASLGGR